MIKLNEFSLALEDVQHAIKAGLQSNLKGEAYWIMGICYKALGEKNRSDIAFNLAKNLFGPDLEKKLVVLEYDMNETYVQKKSSGKGK